MIPWFYDFSKFVLWVYFRAGFRLEVQGREHLPADGPFVLAANHVSYFDPPALAAACPRGLRFMARADLFTHPLLGAFMWGVGVIPLQRGEGDVSALREAVRRLNHGEVVAIFPEGGRQCSGQLGQARRGVGLLAMTARTPVVPALIQGTFQALPPDARWPSKAKIRVAFGKPIPYTNAPLLAGGTTVSARERHEALARAVTQAWRDLAQPPT